MLSDIVGRTRGEVHDSGHAAALASEPEVANVEHAASKPVREVCIQQL